MDPSENSEYRQNSGGMDREAFNPRADASNSACLSGVACSSSRHEASSSKQYPTTTAEVHDKPKISSWDAGWNVTNSIQGMFVLGLPYAVMYGGYWGLLLIVITAVVCCYTGKILVKCLYEQGEDKEFVRVRRSYVDVATACWGNVGGHVVNAAQLIELIMTCVLYIVVSGNLMASSFPTAPIHEAGWSTLATITLAPCIFIKNLRAVSKLSMGCTVAQAIVVVITMLYCMTKITTWAWYEISLSINPRSFPVAIGVIVFSYTSQIFLPSLEGDMKIRSAFNKMLHWSYAAACASKFIFALLCFLTWSYNTKEVITDSLPPGLRVIISLVLVAKALLSYPLPYYASVEVLEQTVFNGRTGGAGTLFRTKAHPYEDLSDGSSPDGSPVVERPKSLDLEVGPRNDENTNLKSLSLALQQQTPSANRLPSCYTTDGDVQPWATGLRLLLVLGTYIIALFIPHFALLMGLTGSLTGSTLAFVFPSAFYLQLHWNKLNKKEISCNFAIIIVGFICCVSGIYHSLQGLYSAYSSFPVYDVTLNSSILETTDNSTLMGSSATTATPFRDLIIFNEPGPMPGN